MWYGTGDAPAPLDEIVGREGLSIVVGASPASPANSVNVRFRVDGGLASVAPGRELHVDLAKDSQYFIVPFGPWPSGQVVEYGPVLTCAGRQVPAPSEADRFPSKFFLAQPPSPRPPTTGPQRLPRPEMIPEFDFVAAVSLHVDQPVFIGETPEGVRIDFFVLDGTVEGPRLKGRVLPRSADHMFVRRDGIGVLGIRAVLAMDDGAMIEVEERGRIELGADGYERALAKNLPLRSHLVCCPRLLTGHSKYLWLNRLQCVGLGETRLDAASVHYDLFAVQGRQHRGSARAP
jgi:hypothetical protein